MVLSTPMVLLPVLLVLRDCETLTDLRKEHIRERRRKERRKEMKRHREGGGMAGCRKEVGGYEGSGQGSDKGWGLPVEGGERSYA